MNDHLLNLIACYEVALAIEECDMRGFVDEWLAKEPAENRFIIQRYRKLKAEAAKATLDGLFTSRPCSAQAAS